MRAHLEKFSLLLVLLLGSAAAMSAENREAIDVSKLGPQVGELVPQFELPDQHGQLQTLESVRGPNGSLILFHRSADW